MRLILSLLFCAAGARPADAGEKIEALALRTLDDRVLTMSNYHERLGTAVVFLSARGVADERSLELLEAINERCRHREILVVGVFPKPAESAAEILSFTQNFGMRFPVYRDPEGHATSQLRARVTPEAYLLDRAGRVVYHGAVAGVQDAVEDLLAGRPVRESRRPAEGALIGGVAPARPAEDRYGSVWFSSELIFEKIPSAPAHHASTIAEAANGDLLVVWYGGSYESSDDQTLYLARRKKGERIWGAPQALIRDSLQPPGNAVVFRDGLNRIWIVWARMEASRPVRRGGGWSRCRLMYRVSSDHGFTWNSDQAFNEVLGVLPRNVPVLLPDRSLLLPMGAPGGSFFLKTADDGKTWVRSALIPVGGQPTVAQKADGTLLALMRKRPRILHSESRDGGLSWSVAAPTPLRNPDTGIALTHLRNGDLVLVFNDSETSRTPLSIARSVDGGGTWQSPLTLESNPGEYSYPSVIQSSDGRIHVVYTSRRYTIKHVDIDDNWLTLLERPN